MPLLFSKVLCVTIRHPHFFQRAPFHFNCIYANMMGRSVSHLCTFFQFWKKTFKILREKLRSLSHVHIGDGHEFSRTHMILGAALLSSFDGFTSKNVRLAIYIVAT